MSNTVRLAVAVALTAVTATGALAASQHRGAYPRVYSGYTNSLDAAYGAPQRGWAYTAPQAYWRGYAPAYNAYSNSLDTALGAPPYAGYY